MPRTLVSKEAKRNAYMKAFQKAMNGENFPISPDDWSNAEYYFRDRQPVEKAIGLALERRRTQYATAERHVAKIWRDEFDGTLQVGPGDVPEFVRQRMELAVENGLTHGTLIEWAPVRGHFGVLLEYTCQQWKWETLS